MWIEGPAARLCSALRENHVLCEALHRLAELEFPDWYLGAGCIPQTIWNLAAGNVANDGILDYDFVYFDPDISQLAERAASDRASRVVADLNIRLDVKNQARVHLWYGQRFGYDIVPYSSSADAISTWPTTASAVGIRADRDVWSVHAPFGVEDLLNHIVRPNRVQITRAIYRAKADRWRRKWPFLTVLRWEQGVGTERLRWAPRSTP
jgi:uncharacterized protein